MFFVIKCTVQYHKNAISYFSVTFPYFQAVVSSSLKNINIPCIILVLSYWYFLYVVSGLCLFRCSYPILWRLHAQTKFSHSTLGSAENVDLFDYFILFFWLVWFWFWKGFYKVFLFVLFYGLLDIHLWIFNFQNFVFLLYFLPLLPRPLHPKLFQLSSLFFFFFF